jgi:hypothetical protein
MNTDDACILTVAILISGIRSRDRKSALALLKSLTSKMGVAVEILFLGAVVPEICLGSFLTPMVLRTCM